MLWASRKQLTVAPSSCEVEYAALSAAASEELRLQGLLEDVKKVQERSKLFEDNRPTQGRLKIDDLPFHNLMPNAFTKAMKPWCFRDIITLLGLTDLGRVLK